MDFSCLTIVFRILNLSILFLNMKLSFVNLLKFSCFKPQRRQQFKRSDVIKFL
jgi:hypothetical protein